MKNSWVLALVTGIVALICLLNAVVGLAVGLFSLFFTIPCFVRIVKSKKLFSNEQANLLLNEQIAREIENRKNPPKNIIDAVSKSFFKRKKKWFFIKLASQTLNFSFCILNFEFQKTLALYCNICYYVPVWKGSDEDSSPFAESKRVGDGASPVWCKLMNITSEPRAELTVSLSGCSPLTERRMTVRLYYRWLAKHSLCPVCRAKAILMQNSKCNMHNFGTALLL